MRDPDSIFYHYQKLIKLRKEYDIVTEGTFELLAEDDPAVLAYVRHGKDEKLLCINNFYGKEADFTVPLKDTDGWRFTVPLTNDEPRKGGRND